MTHCCPVCILSKIQAESLEWIGTPFHARACIKQVGVDCVNLVFAIYQAAGVIPGYLTLPSHYPMDGGHHLQKSKVLDFLQDVGVFFEVHKPDARPGDILLLNMGRVIHHVGIVVHEKCMIHAMSPGKVTFAQIDDPTISKRIDQVHRPAILEPMNLTLEPRHVPKGKCCK